MTKTLVGTSGWSYNEWNGAFYPNTSVNKLSYYSKLYDTVEVDSTFYAFPSKGMVLGWARYTPENFVFSVKLPRQLTHDKKLNLSQGVEADLVRFLGLLRPLIAMGKLGPILVQLPPSCTFQDDFEKLKGFFDRVPEDVMFAVEFRHPSWIREDVWSYLLDRNIANVIVDEPLLPPETVVTADFAFIRWHGRGNRPWYNYRYSDEELDAWVPRVKNVTSRVKKTFGYFNNHFKGFAVENSLKMIEKLGMSTLLQDEARTKATKFIMTGKRDAGEGSMLEFVGEASDR
ncbi:MAG: DUF72 domain-containing protein [Nitrososphaerota archaeon]|nr:DUF72 domain-containing protein [Nitrososphaerota archaeon]MDG6942316.1 DUF72 domain-containing protein [Nitrososphaerota archaeon]MDG6942781.1 DUF72 domain-containing protein [Nitrososphaerota archaeon]MDG6948568.1 DUF72 domain-containing protein [Nitrososphaerota archaeon]MDG6950494.1 DUF72 domain-containing protein [Nitrososphaerota archaeon]